MAVTGLMKLFRRISPAETRAHHFAGKGVSSDSLSLSCMNSDSTWKSVSAIDPKPKYTTDRYQVVQWNDVINIKTTFPLR